eukprot:1145673-Pelagomonas_calceolata.AAC.1
MAWLDLRKTSGKEHIQRCKGVVHLWSKTTLVLLKDLFQERRQKSYLRVVEGTHGSSKPMSPFS